MMICADGTSGLKAALEEQYDLLLLDLLLPDGGKVFFQRRVPLEGEPLDILPAFGYNSARKSVSVLNLGHFSPLINEFGETLSVFCVKSIPLPHQVGDIFRVKCVKIASRPVIHHLRRPVLVDHLAGVLRVVLPIAKPPLELLRLCYILQLWVDRRPSFAYTVYKAIRRALRHLGH